MRPNQQNNKNRSRGRNNNGGRKHLNPLSRNYESNGPDGKVRGNAAHVAEKYLQLARDAQSSGDSVMAENFLQHAEHYFRIVASAQPQQRVDQFGQPQQVEAYDADEDFEPVNDRFASPERFQPPPPQPMQGAEGQPPQPAEGAEPAEATAEGQFNEGEAAAADGEMPRRHRDRRSRRRGRGMGGEQGGNSDPAGSPQPEVGELPAFLTAGTPTAAE